MVLTESSLPGKINKDTKHHEARNLASRHFVP
jgi:hypothetical protein